MRVTRVPAPDTVHGARQGGVEGRSTVQSVDRTLDLFELVVAGRRELGLRDLSEATGIPVGTVHRLVSVLVQRGYLAQNPATRRYTVGRHAVALARSMVESGDIAQRAEPFLRELVDLTGESANLAALDGTDAVYLAHVGSPRTVRMFTEAGRRAPLYATGTGKVLLAFLEPPQRDATLARMELRRYTATTITARDVLLDELAQIRAQGYAHDNGEYEDGVRCIAVPLADATGKIVAALSVSGPDGRFTRARVDAWLPQIVGVANRLSATMRASAG